MIEGEGELIVKFCKPKIFIFLACSLVEREREKELSLLSFLSSKCASPPQLSPMPLPWCVKRLRL